MGQFINLVGQKFGRMTVTSLSTHKSKHGGLYWHCICDCGAEKRVSGSLLRRGEVLSCGCLSQENKTKHGMARTKTYRSWRGMRRRCSEDQNVSFPDYGGRGIKVCERWESFENFYTDMGERPDGATLDRIDPNGDYEPKNCRWATSKEQRRNCRNTVFVDYEGTKQTLAELCERLGVSYTRAWRRMKMGFSVEDACTNHDFRKKAKA